MLPRDSYSPRNKLTHQVKQKDNVNEENETNIKKLHEDLLASGKLVKKLEGKCIYEDTIGGIICKSLASKNVTQQTAVCLKTTGGQPLTTRY